MRSIELAKVATAAEALRLRRIARRQALRGAYAAGAVVFALALLVVLHFLIYLALTSWVRPVPAALILLVLDGIVAGVLGYFALNNVPDSIETEAQEIRAQAVIELKRSLTVMGMAAEVAGAVFRTGTVQRGVRRGFAASAAEMASRMLRR